MCRLHVILLFLFLFRWFARQNVWYYIQSLHFNVKVEQLSEYEKQRAEKIKGNNLAMIKAGLVSLTYLSHCEIQQKILYLCWLAIFFFTPLTWQLQQQFLVECKWILQGTKNSGGVHSPKNPAIKHATYASFTPQ